MDGHTWIARFAEQLGVEAPDAALVEMLGTLAS